MQEASCAQQHHHHKEHQFLVRLLGRGKWWEHFISEVVVSKEWQENIQMSRFALINLSERVCRHVEGSNNKNKGACGCATVAWTL